MRADRTCRIFQRMVHPEISPLWESQRPISPLENGRFPAWRESFRNYLTASGCIAARLCDKAWTFKTERLKLISISSSSASIFHPMKNGQTLIFGSFFNSSALLFGYVALSFLYSAFFISLDLRDFSDTFVFMGVNRPAIGILMLTFNRGESVKGNKIHAASIARHRLRFHPNPLARVRHARFRVSPCLMFNCDCICRLRIVSKEFMCIVARTTFASSRRETAPFPRELGV